jgi:GNAT superfamily N-acetyltransferase
MVRYLEPDDGRYQSFAEAFFGTLFDLRVDGGGEVRVAETLDAVSLWNPPGGNRHGAGVVEAALDERVVRLLDAAGRARWETFDGALNAIHPHEPHWYLGVVGVRPDRQGAGLGGRVIRALLDDPATAGSPAYLVTGAPGNRAIYERLGFRVCAEIDLPDGPHLWGMWRSADG